MALAAEDEAAFSEFVVARSAGLLRTASLLAGDPYGGEDLLQTALLKTYLAWPRIRDRAAVESYVRRTMVTTVTSWRRRRWRGEISAERLPEPANDDSGLSLAERLDLWTALRTLTPRQRAVIVLRFYEDLPEAEIARVLGCSPGTVKSQCSKGLAKLRQRHRGEPGQPTSIPDGSVAEGGTR